MNGSLYLLTTLLQLSTPSPQPCFCYLQIWSLFSMSLPFSVFFCFFFSLCHTACGMLVPQPVTKLVTLAVEMWYLNHWTTREVLVFCFKFHIWVRSYSIFFFLLWLISLSTRPSKSIHIVASLVGFPLIFISLYITVFVFCDGLISLSTKSSFNCVIAYDNFVREAPSPLHEACLEIRSWLHMILNLVLWGHLPNFYILALLLIKVKFWFCQLLLF